MEPGAPHREPATQHLQCYLANLAALYALEPELATAIEGLPFAQVPPLETTRDGNLTVRLTADDGKPAYAHSRYRPLVIVAEDDLALLKAALCVTDTSELLRARRLTRVEGLAGRCLFVRARDREPAEQALRQAGLVTQIDLLAEDPGARGDRVPHRRLDDLDAIAWLAEQLAEYDDRLVFLGGHGDPLAHLRFAEACRLLRSAGVYGIGVGTPLVELTEENLEALFANEIDVVEVRLDAHSAATYERVHKRDGFARVEANIERIEHLRKHRQAPRPIVVCSLTRSATTLAEMEAFFDGWIRRIGSAVIHGYNDYCSRLPPDSLLAPVPPVGVPCRRLSTRLMLLADGTISLCAQDFWGAVGLGNWTTGSLRGTWTGATLQAVRQSRARLELETLPACVRCTEWFRP